MKKTVVSLLILALTFLTFVAVMIAIGHAEPTVNSRPNSLGVLEVYQNHNAYLLAMPIDGQVLDRDYTNIRFWPYGTPALYEETILFCGDVSEYFSREPVIIIYEKQAHTMYQGIACHKLVGALSIKGADKDDQH